MLGSFRIEELHKVHDELHEENKRRQGEVLMRISKLRARLTQEGILLDHYRQAFFRDLVIKTDNFSNITWLGYPIWQNVLDLWSIQEAISEIKPALLVECGTNRGGSALFFAHLFDLLGQGRIITIDVQKLHSFTHPQVEFLHGSSIQRDIVAQIQAQATASPGPVMVILDSDHSAEHVYQEMEVYGPLVTPGTFLLVQDGVINTLDMFAHARPGPLVAILQFLEQHPEFAVDTARSERFLISHHPAGWLRRKSG
jgi:cephalosporin hydroxylase